MADETDAGAPSATPEPAEPTADALAEETAPHVVATHAAAPRRSGWKIALAVVGVIVIVCGAAVGGVLYGRASAPGPDIIVTPEPVVEESAAIEPMPVGTLPIPPSSPAGGAQADRPGTPAVPPAILTAAPDLPDTATVASGYRLVNAGISGAQVAGVLAAALGASGRPVEEDGSWVVGTPGAPMLTVNDDPLFTWTFEDTGVRASPAPGEQLEPATAIELTSALLGQHRHRCVLGGLAGRPLLRPHGGDRMAAGERAAHGARLDGGVRPERCRRRGVGLLRRS